MALDDRDRNFEKALARHLRSSATPGADASASSGAPADACPDAEILAAYHDGSLLPDELNFWKKHVVGCDDCQLVLEHLATSLEIPVNLETSGKVISATQSVAPHTIASPTRIPHRLPRGGHWRWIAPAGAVAAGLLAWVVLREPKPLQRSLPQSVEVAENRPLASAAPPAQSAPGDSVATKENKEKDQRANSSSGAITGAVSADRDAAARELHKQAQAAQQTPFDSANKTAPGLSGGALKQGQQPARIAAGGAAGAFDQKKFDVQAAPKPSERARQDAANQPPPPPPPALVQSNGQPSFMADGTVASPLADKASQPAPTPPATPSASKAKAANVDAISAVTETVEVSSEPQTRSELRAMMRTAALQDPHVFAAPGGKQLWRLGVAGALEHSTNNGEKWTQQATGVTTDLLAGSAPSAKISWIVGRSGTILRTTDGGAHWTKLDSPVTNDLTGIRATDATHAWIWFVPDVQTGFIKTYQTADGGATWTSVISQ